jgi:hypothetical protein
VFIFRILDSERNKYTLITAIIDKLKTGTIQNVYPRGSIAVNPQPPYVVVWGPELIPQPGYESRGKNQYFISVHFSRGCINELDDYIYNEIVDLLNEQVLVMRDLRKAKLQISGAPSNLIEGNDDNTISKERVFITAGIYN